MKRKTCKQRTGWQDLIAKQGLTFSKYVESDGTVDHYWREGAYYSLSSSEVSQLEGAATIVFDMLVEAGDWIANMPEPERTAFMRDKMRIPEIAHQAVLRTWHDEPACQSVYGRFDFGYAEGYPPKLYEFNAQTPTGLVEASYVQWVWHDETGIGKMQWNTIWGSLIDAWKRNLAELGKKLRYDGDWPAHLKPTIHFAYSSGESQGEDEITVSYLMDACYEAGYNVQKVIVDDIKLYDGRFWVPREDVGIKEIYEDGELEHLDVCFMLYPWEWVWNEEWSKEVFADMNNVGQFSANGTYIGGTVWFEAPYKMLWSNKAILAVLWHLFGNDPEKSKYLIPAWFKGDEPKNLVNWVEKPVFAREGASIKVFQGGNLEVITEGEYDSEKPEDYVVQQFMPPSVFSDANGLPMHAVVGVWMIDGEPAGLGVREDVSVITTNDGYFVPYAVE